MTVRVAAVQFGIGVDIDENLATCLRMIDKAAAEKPDLMVLPEFCNHASWYDDRDHSYAVALDLDDSDFLNAIAAKAKEHTCYIMINVTVRRDDHKVTGTNVLFAPDGSRAATSDKQVLMGNENNFLEKASHNAPIIELPFGKVGMYSCMDGVINETPRGLALRGAQVMLNSLNSFAYDEGALHIPVRASENKVYVVAANKVDWLVPEQMARAVGEKIQIDAEQLKGAGESQIVAPDGTVLAKAPAEGEAVVVADIDATLADDKKRPDGTDIFASRRPELYAPIAEEAHARHYTPGAERVTTAVYQPRGDSPIEEAADALVEAARQGAELIVLPELFFVDDALVSDPAAIATQSRQMIDTLQVALTNIDNDCYAVTSIVEAVNGGFAHSGVVIGKDGIVLSQRQLHASKRHDWVTVLGDDVAFIDLPFGRIGLVTGNDSIYPETFRLLALKEVEVAALPTHIMEPWELKTGLLERAAENRMSIVVGSRPSDAGASAIITVDEDFTLWTPWKNRPFDGNINYPLVTQAGNDAGLTLAEVYPANSGNRTVTQQTDVVDNRPWWLLHETITKQG